MFETILYSLIIAKEITRVFGVNPVVYNAPITLIQTLNMTKLEKCDNNNYILRYTPRTNL